MLKKSTIAAIFAAFVLSACGGGGSTSTAPAPANNNGGTGANQTISPLPVFLNPTTLIGTTINLVTAGETVIASPSVNGVVNVAATGSTVKIADNATLSALNLSGNANSVILGVGASAVTVSITGINNTIYLPQNSVQVLSIVGAGTVVKYYKP
jgi:hypothetical protein